MADEATWLPADEIKASMREALDCELKSWRADDLLARAHTLSNAAVIKYIEQHKKDPTAQQRRLIDIDALSSAATVLNAQLHADFGIIKNVQNAIGLADTDEDGRRPWQTFSNRSRQLNHLLFFAASKYQTGGERQTRSGSFKNANENLHFLAADTSGQDGHELDAISKFPASFKPISTKRGQVVLYTPENNATSDPLDITTGTGRLGMVASVRDVHASRRGKFL